MRNSHPNCVRAALRGLHEATIPAAAALWATADCSFTQLWMLCIACKLAYHVAVVHWKKKAGLLCFVLSTEGEMPRLTPADPSKQGGEVAKSLEAVPGSSPEPERSTALSSVPWQLSTWNVTALENCTSASPQFQECSRKWAESYWFWWMLEKPVFPLRLHVLFHDAGVA